MKGWETMTVQSTETDMTQGKKPRILIGSPIRQKPAVLKQFLASLENLDRSGLEISYMFFDDNTDSESARVLQEFAAANGRTSILSPVDAGGEEYVCDEQMHHWKEAIIWKVAEMKNRILAAGLERGYSHVFLADSDLVFHPRTLQQLLAAGRDLVSAVFWTKWQPETVAMPQVWLHGEYEHHPLVRHTELRDEERWSKVQRFYATLRKPGIYEVGGLGACTLISRKAVKLGASFAEIRNLGYWGEDRHFCIRAAALGLSMYVETTYPAYHIYRESELAGVEGFLADCTESGSVDSCAAGAPSSSSYAFDMLSYGYEDVAMEEFRQFLAASGGTAEEQTRVYLELDACYGRRGDPEEGRRLLLHAVSVLQRAEIYCRLGSKCMDQEQWSEAAVWLKAALSAKQPEAWEESPDPETWTWKPCIQLCVCYVKLGDWRKAHEYNEMGLSFHPDHPTMLANRQVLTAELTRTGALPLPLSSQAV